METVIVLNIDGATMSRETFRRVVKIAFQKPVFALAFTHAGCDWAANIANLFGEISKNIYDHGGKKGTLRLTISPVEEGSEAIIEGYDYGPGYRGGSPKTSFRNLLDFHFRNSTLPMDNGINAGLGLSMIEGGLNGIRGCKGVTSLSYEVTTRQYFGYKIRILFNG